MSGEDRSGCGRRNVVVETQRRFPENDTINALFEKPIKYHAGKTSPRENVWYCLEIVRITQNTARWYFVALRCD